MDVCMYACNYLCVYAYVHVCIFQVAIDIPTHILPEQQNIVVLHLYKGAEGSAPRQGIQQSHEYHEQLCN